jgi:hypothetical protein
MARKINKRYNPWIKYPNPKLKDKTAGHSPNSAKLMELVRKFSSAGSLTQIANDRKMLAKFNKAAAKLGYKLTIDHEAIVPPGALYPARLIKI